MRNEWTYRKVGDVFKTSSGGTPQASRREYYEGGRIKWLRSGEVSQGEIWDTELRITEEGMRNSSAKLFPVDTIVVAMYGATTGQVGILKDAMTTNQAICGIFPNPDVKPTFLAYFLKSQKQRFLEMASGAAQPNISQQIIKNTFFPLAPLPEQEHIVAELDLLSGIIDKYKQQLKELDTLAQSIFYEISFGIIANGSEVKRLGDVATFVNGYPFKPETWTETGLPIIRIQNLNNPQAPYNHYFGPIPEKYVVRQGDILISWSASLGAYEWKGEDAYLNQHIFKVVFDKCPIDKHFLRYAVQSKLTEMEKDTHGATMRHIVKKDFDNTLIPFPSYNLQNEFSEKIEAIEKQKELAKRSIVETETLFNSRMDYWFN